MIIEIAAILIVVIAAAWVIAAYVLSAPDHSQFDLPHVAFPGSDSEASAGNEQVLELLGQMHATIKSVPRRRQIAELRRLMDEAREDSAVA